MNAKYMDLDRSHHLLGQPCALFEAFLPAFNVEGCCDMGADREPSVFNDDLAPKALGLIDELIEDNRTYQREQIRRTGTTPALATAPFDFYHTLGQGEPARSYAVYMPEEDHIPRFKFIRFNKANDDWLITVPLQMMLKDFPMRKGGSMGYCHSVAVDGKTYRYYGITQRHWRKRMSEHMQGIANGERKKFYNAWRAFAGEGNVSYQSELCLVNATYQSVMEWEEEWVDREMLAGTSLNMIPGGFKGIRELHKLRINAGRTVQSYIKAMKQFERTHPERAGVPNPLLSKLWEDDNYATKMICNTKLGRLEQEQVIRIRQLNYCDIPVEKITEMVGARNQTQVERVLAGETYSRIH